MESLAASSAVESLLKSSITPGTVPRDRWPTRGTSSGPTPGDLGDKVLPGHPTRNGPFGDQIANTGSQAVFSRILGLLIGVLTQYLLGLPQMAALVDGYEVECCIDVVPH